MLLLLALHLLQEGQNHDDYGVGANSVVFGVVELVPICERVDHIKDGSQLGVVLQLLFYIPTVLGAVVTGVLNSDVDLSALCLSRQTDLEPDHWDSDLSVEYHILWILLFYLLVEPLKLLC